MKSRKKRFAIPAIVIVDAVDVAEADDLANRCASMTSEFVLILDELLPTTRIEEEYIYSLVRIPKIREKFLDANNP